MTKSTSMFDVCISEEFEMLHKELLDDLYKLYCNTK
jgi:hypothetical protein